MSVFDLPMTARPGKDAIAGQDELGRTVYRTVTGERYTMPERTEMPSPTMGQRFENLGGLASRAYENLSVQGAIDAAKGIGEGIVSGIVQGFTAPGRALSGEPVSLGDVLATAGMAQVGAAPMRAPAGALRSGAMGRPPASGIKAYHGSPHSFDKFSMDAIGTGEGAQAYGHGLYFADNEGVARSYRDALSGSTGNAQHTMLRKVMTGTTPDRVLPAMQRIYPGMTADDVARLTKEMKTAASPGSMYEVNINADPADFLDWDKPLSEQPNVLNRLGFSSMDEDAAHAEAVRIFEENPNGAWMNDPALKARVDELNNMLDRRPPSGTGQDFYRGGASDDVSGILSQMGYGDPAAQSQALRDAGIPGIRYLDAGSRGAGDGSRNYVVFDENLINIVRKYGIAGAAAMLGMSQADVAQAMGQGQQNALAPADYTASPDEIRNYLAGL
jgi:hypothetical protein